MRHGESNLNGQRGRCDARQKGWQQVLQQSRIVISSWAIFIFGCSVSPASMTGWRGEAPVALDQTIRCLLSCRKWSACISQDDCQAFSKKLLGKETPPYRLPTAE